jgi:hypothetical protein
MARPPKATTSEVTKALSPTDTPERFKMSEIGYSGYTTFSGITQDELYRELQFPNSIKLYDKMSYSPAINSPLSLFDNLISKVQFRMVPPQDATETELLETKFINECLHDMDTTFRTVIRDCLTSNKYGFAVLEKVYRRRNKASGSKFTDNKIALKKLALRQQTSIEKFVFSEDGSEIIGVKQLIQSSDPNRYAAKGTSVVIPREKFLHVVCGKNQDDPYGRSMLRSVYIPWRYLEVLQELESSGIAKDLNGLMVMKIPAQYLSSEASTDQKVLLENFKNIVRNAQQNSQSGILLPSNVDEATRVPLFDVSLLSADGKKLFDIDKVKGYYTNQIYTALSSDLLIQGQSSVGSFALAQVKSTLTGAAVETMLLNIVESIQRDVVRDLYERNGMDTSRMATLDYEGLNNTDLDVLSKFLQRTQSVGLFEVDRDVLNLVRKSVGIDPLPNDLPPQKELMNDITSRSGDGFKTAGEGTATNVSGTDTTSDNLENNA